MPNRSRGTTSSGCGRAGTLARFAPDATVVAIGICSQVNTHVFVDAELVPVHPAISWQDQRCADAATELERRVGDDTQRIFGGPFAIDASYALSRALWLQETYLHAWNRTRWILSPKDFCIATLTGSVRTDRVSPVGLGAPTVATSTMPSPSSMERRQFPPLDEFDATAGRTTGAFGFPAGVPTSVGTMDAWSSIYGSGVVRPGQGAEISGYVRDHRSDVCRTRIG